MTGNTTTCMALKLNICYGSIHESKLVLICILYSHSASFQTAQQMHVLLSHTVKHARKQKWLPPPGVQANSLCRHTSTLPAQTQQGCYRPDNKHEFTAANSTRINDDIQHDALTVPESYGTKLSTADDVVITFQSYRT